MTRRDRPFWTRSIGAFATALALAAFGITYVPVQAALPPPPDSPGSAPASEAAIPASASVLPPGNPLWAVPLTELSATRDRPIFSASRRPPAPAVFAMAAAVTTPAPPPPPKAERPPLILVGTIIGETRQFAVFVEETTQKFVRLELGADHAGWILRLVNSAEARLENAHQIVTLLLRPPSGEPAKGSEAAAVSKLIPPVRHRKRDR